MVHLAEEQIWSYITGEAKAEEVVHVESHIGKCKECEGLYKECLKAHQELQQLEHEVPSMRFSTNVVEALQDLAVLTLKPLKFPTFRYLLLASSLLVVGCSFYLFFEVDASGSQVLTDFVTRKNLQAIIINLLLVLLGVLGLLGLDRLLRKRFRERLN